MNETERSSHPKDNADIDKHTRTWSMFLHLSLLANLFIPLSGLVAAILIWQLKKEDLPVIDAHGKNAINAVISMLIYSVIGLLLSLVVVGFVLLVAVIACSIIFPIIAGIKANNGIIWKYPLCFSFID